MKEAGAELAYHGIMDPDATPADMIEIEPHNGLLIALQSAAGEFFYWQAKLRADPEDEEAKRNLREMRDSRMTMARISKMALDAGLAERQVAMQERMAWLMAQFADKLLKSLPLTAEQEKLIPGLVERSLLALETGEQFTHSPRPTQALRHFKVRDVVES